MKISIGVVIPCFNARDTIEACINSVLSQSVEVDEIIVIDDGSTDDTRTVVQMVFELIPTNIRKVFVEQKNAGPSVARNHGVRISTASYIAFLDSDDRWFADKIKAQKAFLIQNLEYALVGTKYTSAPFDYYGEVSLTKLLLRNYFLTPCVMVDKKVFEAAGGFNENMRYAEDYHLWLKIVSNRKGYILDVKGAESIENKRIFGDKGLSGNLQAMHKGVLEGYKNLKVAGKISRFLYLSVFCLEKIKYLRRLVLVNIIK